MVRETQKYLLPIGVAGRLMTSFEDARNETYTTKDNQFPPTPFIHKDNPFSDEFKNAESILEIGCGIGRNVPYIMENTKANYVGIEPNPTMYVNFWNYVPDKYWSRIELYPAFVPKIKGGFNYIISTFVFQHIGYRTPQFYMNIDDIYQEMLDYSYLDTRFFLLEHDNEEPGWIDKWFLNNNIHPTVYIRDWQGAPELNDRGNHHLIIF